MPKALSFMHPFDQFPDKYLCVQVVLKIRFLNQEKNS